MRRTKIRFVEIRALIHLAIPRIIISAAALSSVTTSALSAGSVCISKVDFESLRDKIKENDLSGIPQNTFKKVFTEIGSTESVFVKTGLLYKCANANCEDANTFSGSLVSSVLELKGLKADYVSGANEIMHGNAGNGGDSTPGTPQVSGGASGPPALTTLEVSGNQAEEFVRQRRELAQQQNQQVALLSVPPPVPVQQP